jgi:hypothetical protein
MKLDPRLRDPTLLALAGLRLKQRGPATQMVTLQVVYVDSLDQSIEQGPQYTYHMPIAQLDRTWQQRQP